MKKLLILCMFFIVFALPCNIYALGNEGEQPVCECTYDETGNLVDLCDYHLEYGVDTCGLLCPQGGCW